MIFRNIYPPVTEENSDPLPKSFLESVTQLKNLILKEFDREIAQKQLYYHSREHVTDVEQRAKKIFQAIRPYWEASLPSSTEPNYIERMELLLELSAIAHDAIQIFIPQNEPHTTRRREAGVSETATINKLFDYISTLNQKLTENNPNNSAHFKDSDLAIIKEAITATICLYDPADAAIYQPALYDQQNHPSPVTQILALADLGGLGIEGIAYYNQEGSLLFLEENPDILPILHNQNWQNLATTDPELYENIRQRLLKRARFQVNLAKSRLNRYQQEIQGLPAESHPILTKEVFQYLNLDTIKTLEQTTPTNDQTTLETLINFFDFQTLLSKIDRANSQ